MTTYEQTHEQRMAPPTGYTERRAHVGVNAGGFGLSSIIGAGAVVLAIISFAGGWPRVLTSIAVIAIGTTLLLEGIGIGNRYRKERGQLDAMRKLAGGGALSVEFIGGAAAVTLGILALVNIAPVILLNIATICYGAAFVLTTGGAFTFGMLSGPARRHDDVGTRALVASYAAARPVAGMAAVILGILGLTAVGNPHQVLFTLVSILAVGSAAFLGGLVLGGGVATRSHA